jgi:hypothetical protein
VVKVEIGRWWNSIFLLPLWGGANICFCPPPQWEGQFVIKFLNRRGKHKFAPPMGGVNIYVCPLVGEGEFVIIFLNRRLLASKYTSPSHFAPPI